MIAAPSLRLAQQCGVATSSIVHRVLAAAVMTGSHADAIPLAGAYDGTLGIIGGEALLKYHLLDDATVSSVAASLRHLVLLVC